VTVFSVIVDVVFVRRELIVTSFCALSASNGLRSDVVVWGYVYMKQCHCLSANSVQQLCSHR